MIRTKDLRCWTQALLSAMLLALLKGFLAWSTVAPDAEGWEACQERLGEHGLKYYRRRAGNTLLHRDIDMTELLIDILLLEVRGLCMPGAALRTHFCGDTMYSSTVAPCVLFTLGLQEAVRASTDALEPTVRLAVRMLVRCLLVLVLVSNAVLPILMRYHYSADVLVALLLGHLVYGNPAVSIMAQQWAAAAARDAAARTHAAASVSCCSGEAVQKAQPLLTDSVEAGAADVASKWHNQHEAPHFPKEVGQVVFAPCCGLSGCCCLAEGLYYLREGAVVLPSAEVSEEAREQQLEYMRSVEEQLCHWKERKENNLAEFRADNSVCTAKAAEEAKQRLTQALADQAHRHAEEKRHLAEELRSLGVYQH